MVNSSPPGIPAEDTSIVSNGPDEADESLLNTVNKCSIVKPPSDDNLSSALTIRSASYTLYESTHSKGLTTRSFFTSPTTKRFAIAATKTGFAIADGIFLTNSRVNPAITAGLVLYNSLRAVNDYRRGELNVLGYSMTKRDVALKIGKEFACATIGIGIGQLVGAALGLTALPIVGQIAATAVISAGLGIFVGALFTYYVDRAFIRLSIGGQYKYTRSEKKTQARFEKILGELHDLSSIDACRIVQHYMDYRIACGWESLEDRELYMASGLHPSLLPKSLQHFTAVQLERKWGFFNNRSACKKLFRALMLQHHPDRGGNPALAAQLLNDFELYAFCRQWWEECRSFVEASTLPETNLRSFSSGKEKIWSVWSFFKTLFFSENSNSEVEAQNLHAHNFARISNVVSPNTLTPLPPKPGAASGSHVSSHDSCDEASDLSSDDDTHREIYFLKHCGSSVEHQRAAVSRVLSGLERCYQNVVELISSSALMRAAADEAVWKHFLHEAENYCRIQSVLHCLEAQERSSNYEVIHWGMMENGGPSEILSSSRLEMLTLTEIVEVRERSRKFIVSTVFTESVKEHLLEALELSNFAKRLVSNFFADPNGNLKGRSSASGAEEDGGCAASRVIDTLLTIQSKLEEIPNGIQERLENEHVSYTSREKSQLQWEYKVAGLAATSALGGEYALTIFEGVLDWCQNYLRVWSRKQLSFQTLQKELALHEAKVTFITSTSAELNVDDMDDYQSHVFSIEQQLSEVDSLFEELRMICTQYLPEQKSFLSQLPSTVTWGVQFYSNPKDSFEFSLEIPNPMTRKRTAFDCINSRFIEFERELHLKFFQQLEPEPDNPLDPCGVQKSSVLDNFLFLETAEENQDDCVSTSGFETKIVGKAEFTLLRAARVHPRTGKPYFCWLKQYDLREVDVCLISKYTTEDELFVHKTQETENIKAVKKKDILQRLSAAIVSRECSISNRCGSSLVISTEEVFSDTENGSIFCVVPREETQQRFRSVRNIKTNIAPLGLRWLFDALQCVIDLHVSGIAHGNIRLSNFVYDSFGTVSLGYFSSSFPSLSQENDPAELEQDAVDFGIMILSEILPFLGIGEAGTGNASELQSQDHMLVSYKEIGDRLVAKAQPPFTLLDARTYACNCLQLSILDMCLERKARTKFPVEWGRNPASGLSHLQPYSCRITGTSNCNPLQVYLNINPPLWERYSCYREELCRTIPPRLPHSVELLSRFLFISDDWQVNERFLWISCKSQLEAWNTVYHGLNSSNSKSGNTSSLSCQPFLYFGNPLKIRPHVDDAKQIIVVCRVALGTVVPGEVKNIRQVPGKTLYFDDLDGDKSSVTSLGPRVLACDQSACYPELVLIY